MPDQKYWQHGKTENHNALLDVRLQYVPNPASPHFAFFAVPDAFGMVTPDNQLIFNCEANAVAVDEGSTKGKNLLPGKAYLQKLYDDIAKR